jgi:hypothetical protein
MFHAETALKQTDYVDYRMNVPEDIKPKWCDYVLIGAKAYGVTEKQLSSELTIIHLINQTD